jgi:cobalt-zinc-cadmium efflux system membrane fusion protein
MHRAFSSRLGWLALPLLLVACGDRDDKAPPPPRTEPGVISFAAGAPDLDALELVPLTQGPLPISADLNARLNVDEDVTARVGTPVAGRVLGIRADIGEQVRAGQVLATLDAPDLAQARSDLVTAEATAEVKRKQAARAGELFAGGATARRDLETAEADARSAGAELTRARQRLQALGSGSGATLAITAPVAGFVLNRDLDPGEVVTAGQSPLFTVTNPRRLWLLVDVPEAAVARLRVGGEVSFEVPAWPGRQFVAAITRVGVGVDPVTRRVQVRAAVGNADLALKPEMYARAHIVSDDGRTGLKLPNAALFEQGLKTYAFKVEAPGRFRRVPVTVAVRGDQFSWVTDGLKAGDKVVGEGALLLNAQLSGGDNS